MKKTIMNFRSILLSVALCSLFTACSNDDDLSDKSVLDISTPELTELDHYVRDNFTIPYNIEVLYDWNEGEIDLQRYLYPPTQDSVQPALEVVKKIWIDSYNEVGGTDFVQKIAPRQLALSGGFNINEEGTITLGFAEGGKKIVLFNVDFLDKSDQENVQQFLGTVQHEYTHILNQTKPFDEQSFGLITPTNYTVNWYETSDANARKLGFVSAYARSSIDEDFAEMVHIFLNYDNEGWNDFIDSIPNTNNAREKIRSKEDIMVSYFLTAFDIDVYELQTVVAVNTQEILNN